MRTLVKIWDWFRDSQTSRDDRERSAKRLVWKAARSARAASDDLLAQRKGRG